MIKLFNLRASTRLLFFERHRNAYFIPELKYPSLKAARILNSNVSTPTFHKGFSSISPLLPSSKERFDVDRRASGSQLGVFTPHPVPASRQIGLGILNVYVLIAVYVGNKNKALVLDRAQQPGSVAVERIQAHPAEVQAIGHGLLGHLPGQLRLRSVLPAILRDLGLA